MPRVGSPLSVESAASFQHLSADLPEPLPTTSTQLSLAQAVHARRQEFTRQNKVRIKVGTWNVASSKGVEQDLGGWFVGGKGVSESLSGLTITSNTEPTHEDEREGAGDQEARWSTHATTLPKNDHGSLPGNVDVGLYILGLQEVVDINSAREALTPYTDPGVANKFKDSLREAMPQGYELVAERQLIGLLLLIYASPSIAPHVRSVSTTSVGTGLMGYMGNKGAVTARIVLGETTRLVFINSHMSAGTGRTESDRRNWDAAQIISRTRFDPITDELGITHVAEKIGDEDFAFWFGDLNYRLDGIPGEDVRRILMLHTRNEYDIGQGSERKIEQEISDSTEAVKQRDRSSTASSHGSSTASTTPHDMQSTLSTTTINGLQSAMKDSSDPTSLQATLNSLLPHDELLQQRESRKMFHDGWREGPITFLPTYKYDRGTVGVFDSGEKKRGPSWCDRILYRTRKDRLAWEDQLREEEEARRRDIDMKAKGIVKAADDEDMLFEYDPDADGDDGYEEAQSQGTGDNIVRHTQTKEGFEDTIRLEYYTSHQRVLSSDHKPLDAGFILHYDAVVPELRAKVQQEVARELDRAENEGRPVVTMVVDRSPHYDSPELDGVDFGKLRYDEPKVRSITIANTGRVSAQFGFANRPDDSAETTPRWFSVRVNHASDERKAGKVDDEWHAGIPKAFTLHPGDTCTVQLIAEITDKDLLRSFNRGQVLEDILILRVKEGRDHFLPIHGVWQHSSHGNRLEKLLHATEGGLRKLQNQHPSDSWSRSSRDRSMSSLSSLSDEYAVIAKSVPRHIARLTECVETLVERILAEWSMIGSVVDDGENAPWMSFAGWPFSEESWTLDVEKRRILRVDVNEALDTDEPFEKFLPDGLSPLHRLEVTAECLIIFLHNLDDGIITEDLWTRLESHFFAKSKHMTKLPLEEQRAAVLKILAFSPIHSASFVHLTAMLAHIAHEIASAVTDVDQASQPTKDLPIASAVTVRRKTLDSNPMIATRQLAVKNFAAIFADVLIRSPETHQAKSRTASLEDRRELIELFVFTPAG